jgi:hypothetical protein
MHPAKTRARALFATEIAPAVDRDWHPTDIDELISLLVKLRDARASREAMGPATVSIGDQFIDAGLVTGWFRENPLLSGHKQVAPPPRESGPEDLRKYRKNLITSAMGSYCGSHAKKGHRKMTKYMNDDLSEEREQQVGDPIASFDEEHQYHQRAKVIREMLDSNKDFDEIASEMRPLRIGGRRDGKTSSCGPDGIVPSFARHTHARICSPISGSPVQFY